MVGTSHSWVSAPGSARRPVPAHLCARCRPSQTQPPNDRQSIGSNGRVLSRPLLHGRLRRRAAGELVELVATFTAPHTSSRRPKVRFDMLEEDAILTGGCDDPVVSLVGTGATAPI